jgi:hypothetical protein
VTDEQQAVTPRFPPVLCAPRTRRCCVGRALSASRVVRYAPPACANSACALHLFGRSPRRACKEHAPRRAAMAFFDLCVAMLLFFNAVAILNEDRFLAKRAALALREGGTSAFWPRFSLRSETLSAAGLRARTADTRAHVLCAGRWVGRPRLLRPKRLQKPERTGSWRHLRRLAHAQCAPRLRARVWFFLLGSCVSIRALR